MKRIIRCTLPDSLPASVNVTDYLAGRFTYYDRKKWQKEIDAGRIRINMKIAACSDILGAGDRIEYACPPLPEPPVNRRYKIIHEDAEVLVVDKPPGLPCHPHGRYFNNTLWALLKKERDTAYFSFINRLDRETSGLVLVAKNKKAAAACQSQFKSRKVKKKYVAMVRGYFPYTLTAEGVLLSNEQSAIRHKKIFVSRARESDELRGKEAVTVFRRLRAYNNLSLVEAFPLTGRQHQIRATLEALNHHLVGDKMYGGDEGIFLRFIAGQLSRRDRHALLLQRQALHAAEIFLLHPASGEPMQFTSPLPEDFLVMMGSETPSFLPP